jgi:hypothetical protein
MQWKKSNKKSDNDANSDEAKIVFAPWTVNHVKGGVYTKKVHPETLVAMADEAGGEKKKKKNQKVINKKRGPSRSISPQPKTKTNIKKNNNDDEDTDEKDRDKTIEVDAFGKPLHAVPGGGADGGGNFALLLLSAKPDSKMKQQQQNSPRSKSPTSPSQQQPTLTINNKMIKNNNNNDNTNGKDRGEKKTVDVGWPLQLPAIKINENGNREETNENEVNNDNRRKSLERARSGDLSRMHKDTNGGWSADSPRLMQEQHA